MQATNLELPARALLRKLKKQRCSKLPLSKQVFQVLFSNLFFDAFQLNVLFNFIVPSSGLILSSKI